VAVEDMWFFAWLLTPTLQNNTCILLKSPRQAGKKKKNDKLEWWWENVLISQYKDNQPTENESTDEYQNTEKIKHLQILNIYQPTFNLLTSKKLHRINQAKYNTVVYKIYLLANLLELGPKQASRTGRWYTTKSYFTWNKLQCNQQWTVVHRKQLIYSSFPQPWTAQLKQH